MSNASCSFGCSVVLSGGAVGAGAALGMSVITLCNCRERMRNAKLRICLPASSTHAGGTAGAGAAPGAISAMPSRIAS
jgi:hypothetical protein